MSQRSITSIPFDPLRHEVAGDELWIKGMRDLDELWGLFCKAREDRGFIHIVAFKITSTSTSGGGLFHVISGTPVNLIGEFEAECYKTSKK